MGVESSRDLAGFFNPKEFGTLMTLGGEVNFSGIDTTSATSLDPAGISAEVREVVPRIICPRSSVPNIQQGDFIEFLEDTPYNVTGAVVTVNDLSYKGSLLIIHYHTGF